MCAWGVIGLVALPREIAKFRSGQPGRTEIVISTAAKIIFVAAGLLLVLKKI